MKTRFITLTFALLFSLSLFAQEISKEHALGEFTKLNCSAGVDVKLFKAETSKLVVKVEDKEDLDKLKFKLNEGELSIWKEDTKKAGFFRISGLSKIEVELYYSSNLSHISSSSGADITSDETLESNNLDMRSSSGADITLAVKANELIVHSSSGSDIDLNVESKTLKASCTSGADIDLKGMVDSVVFNASSGADINAFALKSRVAQANASSAGDIEVNASENLVASASSGGDVTYRGKAKVSKSESSGGDVEED